MPVFERPQHRVGQLAERRAVEADPQLPPTARPQRIGAAGQTFVPLLAANPDGGYIVNTASVAALMPSAGTTAYAASKAAVVAVSEALAAEFADQGHIGISILLPALVRTNIIANAARRPGHHEGAPRTEDFLPPMRVLDPSEVGAMVVAAMRAGQRYIITHPEVAPGIRQAAERAETDMYDERAAADAVNDLVDKIDQVCRGTALGWVRGVSGSSIWM
jgi:short-subunit dehydrogenase